VVYSLAYGDQPALICEMVDWARAAGFEVVAPARAPSTCPATTSLRPRPCGHYGFTPEMVAAGDFNAQMFNSFLDGTKSAIEMAAVANATGPDAGRRRSRLPALRRRRPAAHPAAAGRGRPPRACRAGRGDLQRRARRPAGVPRPALGRVRHLRPGRWASRRDYVRAASRSTASRPTVSGATARCTSLAT
jgi:hypothetical protein